MLKKVIAFIKGEEDQYKGLTPEQARKAQLEKLRKEQKERVHTERYGQYVAPAVVASEEAQEQARYIEDRAYAALGTLEGEEAAKAELAKAKELIVKSQHLAKDSYVRERTYTQKAKVVHQETQQLSSETVAESVKFNRLMAVIDRMGEVEQVKAVYEAPAQTPVEAIEEILFSPEPTFVAPAPAPESTVNEELVSEIEGLRQELKELAKSLKQKDTEAKEAKAKAEEAVKAKAKAEEAARKEVNDLKASLRASLQKQMQEELKKLSEEIMAEASAQVAEISAELKTQLSDATKALASVTSELEVVKAENAKLLAELNKAKKAPIKEEEPVTKPIVSKPSVKEEPVTKPVEPVVVKEASKPATISIETAMNLPVEIEATEEEVSSFLGLRAVTVDDGNDDADDLEESDEDDFLSEFEDSSEEVPMLTKGLQSLAQLKGYLGED